MKLDYKLFKNLLPTFGILALLNFALRVYTYWKELDVTTGFFSGNGAGCVVYNVIAFGVFILCLVLTYRKKGSLYTENIDTEGGLLALENDEDSLLVQDGEPYDEVEEEFPEFFLHGFAKKCSIWLGTFSAFAALLPGFALIGHAISFLLEKEATPNPYVTIYMILTFLSGAFFLYYSFRNSSENSRFSAFFSLVPAFWCTMRMVNEYRDLTRFLNKSLYVGQFLLVISALVFFLHQAQILLGEDKLSRPNAYVFSGMSVVFFGLTARIPQLIAIIGARIQMDLYTSTSLLVDLAITLFVASKLIASTKRG